MEVLISGRLGQYALRAVRVVFRQGLEIVFSQTKYPMEQTVWVTEMKHRPVTVYPVQVSIIYAQSYHMSHAMRKCVFVVLDQTRYKPASSATQTSYTIEILD